MDKNQIIGAFNKHMLDFIMDVERVFPQDMEIKTTRKTMKQTFMLMPRAIIRMFYDNFVVIYGKEIERGDLTFFIDNDYEAKHGEDIKEDPTLLVKINELREPVRNMTDADKQIVVKYMQDLKKLAELYTIVRKGKN
jgi:hypothetical protein